MARVKAVLRRTSGAVASEVIRVGDVILDLSLRRVSRGDHQLELTTSGFELLRILAASPGRVFTRGQLLDRSGESPSSRMSAPSTLMSRTCERS